MSKGMETSNETEAPAVLEDTAITCNVPGVTFSPLGIETDRSDLTRDEYNNIFRSVLKLAKSANWLLGDALNIAERQWGNKATGSKYEEAAAATGLSKGTIRNIALTCKHIPLERRHPELSFTHHVEACAHSTNPDEQDHVLATASEQGQSIKDMRKSVRTRTVELLKKEDENLPPDAPAMDSKADPTGFHLLGLPEKADPDAPPMWDAIKFRKWVEKQEPETYTAEQCEQAVELTEDIADFYNRVLQRQQELDGQEAS